MSDVQTTLSPSAKLLGPFQSIQNQSHDRETQKQPQRAAQSCHEAHSGLESILLPRLDRVGGKVEEEVTAVHLSITLGHVLLHQGVGVGAASTLASG